MPATLQDVLTRAFQGRHGSAAVLRMSDGDLAARHRPDWMKAHESPPGSAVKPFTLKAILRAGAGTALCRRTLVIEGQQLDCSHPPASEPLDAAAALALSCNSWFAEMIPRVRPEVLVREFQAHGLRAGTARSQTALSLQGLGITGVACTPLALARAYRRLALDKAKPESTPFAAIYQGLSDSVRHGTSIAASAGDGVSGKTGTTKEGAWFAGFNGSIALAIFLFQGTGGGDAAPIAGKVFAAWRDGLR